MRMEIFQREYKARWADIDANGHMRHSAYNDYGAQLRVEVFSGLGFPTEKLIKMGIGPVLFREEVKFLNEIRLNETFIVKEKLLAIRKDASKWSVFHEIEKEGGIKAAEIVVDGSWMDLTKRKIVVPPVEIQVMLNGFLKAENFKWIPDKIVS